MAAFHALFQTIHLYPAISLKQTVARGWHLIHGFVGLLEKDQPDLSQCREFDLQSQGIELKTTRVTGLER